MMCEDGQTEKSPNDAVYLQYYSLLQNQQNMLQDSVRTSQYQKAIQSCAQYHIEDRIVLDVGCGSGILSFFALQNKASFVFAVEASKVAQKTLKLTQSAVTSLLNSYMYEKIKIINDKIENANIPKVDAIISEPIGVLLVHERMLESFIDARDRFLKPDGLLIPGRSTICLTPFTDAILWSDTMAKARFWTNENFYGVDLSPLFEDAIEEYFAMPVVGCIPIQSLGIATAPLEHTIDFYTVSKKDLELITYDLHWDIQTTSVIHGIAGWFNVDLLHPTYAKTSELVEITTSPYSMPTHWQQIRFLFTEPLAVNQNQTLKGKITMKAHSLRSYKITMDIEMVLPGQQSADWSKRHYTWSLENQTYHQSY